MKNNIFLKLSKFLFLFFIQFNVFCLEFKDYVPRPDYVPNYDKPFNQYTWLVAHNAYSNYSNFSNQYGIKISKQLELGVRGLMLDLYDFNDEIYLCHKTCLLSEYGTFVEEMNNTIIPFLENNPNEVLTLFLEDHSSKDFFKRALNQVKDLSKYVFNPQKWNDRSNWPTLNELIQKNQRLFIISENEKNSGYFEINSGEVHVIFGQDISVENYWSLGDTYMSHDYRCYSRWKNIPLSTEKASPFYNYWDRIFVMNQFHGIPYAPHSEEDNKFYKLKKREEKYCKPYSKRFPNFIAVDNITHGNALEYVEWHNNGGILFYNKNYNYESLVCGLATTFNRKIPLYKAGCYDYVTKGQLQGVPKGTKILIYSSDYNLNNSEYTEIEVLNDLNFTEPINIDSFDASFEDKNFKLKYFGKNGMKDSVYAVEIIRSNIKNDN